MNLLNSNCLSGCINVSALGATPFASSPSLISTAYIHLSNRVALKIQTYALLDALYILTSSETLT
jgi:hypothetical protein